MLSVANPARRWQRQYALIDRSRSPLPFFSKTLSAFGFAYNKVSICRIFCKARQLGLERLFNALRIIASERVFGAHGSMGPVSGLIGRINAQQLAKKLLAQRGRQVGFESLRCR